MDLFVMTLTALSTPLPSRDVRQNQLSRAFRPDRPRLPSESYEGSGRSKSVRVSALLFIRQAATARMTSAARPARM
jgi:hypothetical protein